MKTPTTNLDMTVAKRSRPWKKNVFLMIATVFLLSAVFHQTVRTDNNKLDAFITLIHTTKDAAYKAYETLSRVDSLESIWGASAANEALHAVKSASLARFELRRTLDSNIYFVHENRKQIDKDELYNYNLILLETYTMPSYGVLDDAIDDFLDNYLVLLQFAIENDESLQVQDEVVINRYAELFSTLEEANRRRWAAFNRHYNALQVFLGQYAEMHSEQAEFIKKFSSRLQTVFQGESIMDFEIIERYEAEAPPPPSGLNVPDKFGYIHFKAYSYLTRGPEAYRQQDAFGMPPEDAHPSILAITEQGCRQILEWRGIDPERPLEGLEINGFYCLIELFHFELIEQSIEFKGDDFILDKMRIKHAVTGEEITLYNLVKGK